MVLSPFIESEYGSTNFIFFSILTRTEISLKSKRIFVYYSEYVVVIKVIFRLLFHQIRERTVGGPRMLRLGEKLQNRHRPGENTGTQTRRR